MEAGVARESDWLIGRESIGGAAGGGKEKFKQLLLDLRKDENAPGASGYASEVK